MSRRYDYDRLTPAEFRELQAELGLSDAVLGALLGYPRERIQRWGKGGEGNDIPHSVGLLMHILAHDPEARRFAFTYMDERIVRLERRREDSS